MTEPFGQAAPCREKAGGLGTINLASLGTGGFVIPGRDAGDVSGISVAAAGDINGDGDDFDDLIVGAPQAGIGSYYGDPPGETYVIFGRDFLGTATHAGTAAGETLIGTVGADTMVGGLGHDTLVGDGGGDVLIGGAGDDTIEVSDLGFARAVGGSGTDTLVLALSGENNVIGADTLSSMKVQDIEQIDLGVGAASNTLMLTKLTVLNLSSTSNTLRVLGDANDSVSFDDSGWVQGAHAAGFTTWSNGQARVEIADGVVPCFAPGTRIATPFGWRAVEALRPGDAVLTVDGEAHPITWAGAWDTDEADPAHRAHAFGPGRPARGLVVSPSHALWLEDVMVPAVALLDGVRVVRDAAPPVRYHHLALAHHAAILAENLRPRRPACWAMPATPMPPRWPIPCRGSSRVQGRTLAFLPRAPVRR